MKLLKRVLPPALALACSLPAGAYTVRGFPHYPRKSNPATVIAARDGCLYGVNLETYPGGGGEVFRMEPNGKLRILHRFEEVHTSSLPNGGGSNPERLLKMGKDGCLYGLTRHGGRRAGGVFYRVSPDGDFAVVAHIPFFNSSPFNGLAYLGQELIEGPDNAFYVITWSGYCVRLGLDGSISVIGIVGNGNWAFADPAEPTHAIVAQASGVWVDDMRMRRVRITDGAILSQVSCPVFPAGETNVRALAYTNRGLLLQTERLQGADAGIRLYWMKAGGSVEFIRDFPWQQAAVEGTPPFNTFLHTAEDGTIYYLTGDSSQGLVHGGDTLIEYSTAGSGSYQVMCGFGGYSMFGLTKAAPDMLYGATLGTSLFVPREPGLPYSANWLERDSGQATLVR